MIREQLTDYMDQILVKRLKKAQAEKMAKKAECIEESKNVLVVSCLVDGMPLNTATFSHGNSYKTEVGSEECSIHPSSVLFGKNLVSKNSTTSTIFDQNTDVTPK